MFYFVRIGRYYFLRFRFHKLCYFLNYPTCKVLMYGFIESELSLESLLTFKYRSILFFMLI